MMVKYSFRNAILILFTVFCLLITHTDASFLTQQDFKKIPLGIIPPPPKANTYDMDRDIAAYKNSLKLRGTKRGKQAALDTVINVSSLLKRFSDAYGMELSAQTTPQLYKLLENFYDDYNILVEPIKRHYNRERPFVVYKQKTCDDKDEKELSKNGSYPSGHTFSATAVALVLVELNPNKVSEIMQVAYEYGQSRTICGYHWQSDVDAARILGATYYVLLHTKENFNKQLALVKKELHK